MDSASGIGALVAFIKRIPSVQGSIGNGVLGDDGWWVKFVIDISHPLAWRTVQELGHVLNYVSINERLPAVFMPVSPPPYINGGPTDFLSWVIECHDSTFPPSKAAEWLEGRLPVPVNDPAAWAVPDDV
jgi:hypothetical protein